ncbi:uncharacterized mitochondrial protein-like protein [Tanacetum coccineum]
MKQGVAIAYTAGPGERNEYAGTLPLCNKCKFHHNGQCTVKCANCKRVGHLTRDSRSLAATKNQRNLTCYECGNQGHYRSDCPELKNNNHGNQAGGTRAHRMVHALGGGETNQDINNILLNAVSITAALIDVNGAHSKLVLLENFNENYSKFNAAEGVNAASEEVSTAELVSTAYLKEFDLLKWDQQVVSRLVALRNFARGYGSRFRTHVIENGATLPKIQVVEGVTTLMPITYAEDKAHRKLEVKARSTLMMGILNKNQLKFNSIKDAKLLLEALSQEDVNQKLLRSLSPEWNTHAVVWRNKAELETMSMDNLYNNIKVYEPEVKGMSSSSSSTHNMDFVSSSNNNTSSPKEAVNAAYGVTTASTQVNTAYSTNIDSLSDAIICSFFASQPNSPQLAHKDLQ